MSSGALNVLENRTKIYKHKTLSSKRVTEDKILNYISCMFWKKARYR